MGFDQSKHLQLLRRRAVVLRILLSRRKSAACSSRMPTLLAQHASRTCQSITSTNSRCRRSSFTFSRSSCRLCCRLSATNRQGPSVLGKVSTSPLRAVCDRSDGQSIAYIFTVVCLDRSCFPGAWREVKYPALSRLSSFQGLPKHFKPQLWRPQQKPTPS